MNDSFGGGFTQQEGDGKQESKSEGAAPVFISQIIKQKEDVMKMWGFEYKMINIVGVVRNIEHSSTKITYTIQDITGRINAHLWVEEGEAPSDSSIMLNTYARVFGSVRHHGDNKAVMVYKIHPVKSINEVNTHYLEVVNTRYQAEEYYRGGSGNGPVKMEFEASAAAISNVSTQGGPTSGKQQAIFNAIQKVPAAQAETGMSRQELYKRFSNFSQAEINKILEDMTSEGHIYSTIDSDHYLSCF